jgi:predicted house-cleaning noncanonical NTP pyrophosphatase (MazG superfamily)
MQMRDNYQPVIIKYLLTHNGSASKRELAYAILKNDEMKVKYCERILMRWPKMTLEKHGIMVYDKKTQNFKFNFQFNENQIQEQELSEIIKICNNKISKWKKTQTYISSSFRYEALKNANKKCQLCGISADLRPLDVDHIIPKSQADKNGNIRNKDGIKMHKDDLRNLQVLCSTCNRGKRDTDNQDFRPKKEKLVRDKIIAEIIAKGKQPVYVKLDSDKFIIKLKEKLLEEYVEFINAENKNEEIDELVDIYEVIKNIAKKNGLSQKEFLSRVQAKRDLKGSFEKRIYLKKNE